MFQAGSRVHEVAMAGREKKKKPFYYLQAFQPRTKASLFHSFISTTVIFIWLEDKAVA